MSPLLNITIRAFETISCKIFSDFMHDNQVSGQKQATSSPVPISLERVRKESPGEIHFGISLVRYSFAVTFHHIPALHLMLNVCNILMGMIGTTSMEFLMME